MCALAAQRRPLYSLLQVLQCKVNIVEHRSFNKALSLLRFLFCCSCVHIPLPLLTAIWLIRLVGDLGLGDDMPILHSDSQSAIMLAKNPVFHAKTKHIEVKYHFLRQVLEDKRLELVKVHTDHNPADFLTKSLPSDKFAHCRELMGIG